MAEKLQERTKGVRYPDMEAVEYKDKCEEIGLSNTSPNVTKKGRANLVARVLRVFSALFWIEGAPSPRVEGFEAKIELKPGAQPRVAQPFPLSRFDQPL